MIIKMLKRLLIRIVLNEINRAIQDSDNKIDDNVQRIVEGAYFSDTEKLTKGAKGLIKTLS